MTPKKVALLRHYIALLAVTLVMMFFLPGIMSMPAGENVQQAEILETLRDKLIQLVLLMAAAYAVVYAAAYCALKRMAQKAAADQPPEQTDTKG